MQLDVKQLTTTIKSQRNQRMLVEKFIKETLENTKKYNISIF
jgi:hypothetical protein